jgi:hypothetical protein
MTVVYNFKISFFYITLQNSRKMSEREVEILSVVTSTWSDDTDAEKSNGYETVDEIEDMEEEWEVIDEIGDSDDPSFEASRLTVVEEGSVQDNLEQSIGQPSSVEHLDGLTVTVGSDSLIRTVKASRLTSDLRLKSRAKAPAGPTGDREEPTDQTRFHIHVLVPTDNKLPKGLKSYERLPAELLPANMKFCPLCNFPKKSHIKRHMLRTHLPWFWSPTTAC